MDLNYFNPYVLMVVSAVGGIAFALSGFLTGVRKEPDVMGIFTLAFLAANGGDVVRDLLIGRTPTVMRGVLPFWLAAGTVILGVVFRLHDKASVEHHRIFIVSDAVGLVAFGIAGALAGISKNCLSSACWPCPPSPPRGAASPAMCWSTRCRWCSARTSTGASPSSLGLAIQLLHRAALMNPLSLSMVFVAGTVLRLVAYERGWTLPKVR